MHHLKNEDTHNTSHKHTFHTAHNSVQHVNSHKYPTANNSVITSKDMIIPTKLPNSYET